MRSLVCYMVVFFAFAKANAQETVASGSLENIVFYYDVSYSMRDRDLDAEIEYLNNYFVNHPEATVTLIQISTALQDETTYMVSGGNWKTLKKALSEVEYDGASDFSRVDFTKKIDRFLLSTDGEESISKLPQSGEKPITIINTVLEDKGDLRWLAESSGGTYEEILGNTNQKKKSSSKVNATVIRAAQSVDRLSNIKESSELEAVVINGQGDNSDRDEYNTIDVRGVSYDKKKLGYSVEKITDKEISAIDTDVKQAVNGQFAGLKVANNTAVTRTDLAQFKGRHDNMTLLGDQTGLIVIDGVPQQKANSAGGRGSLYDIENSSRKGLTSDINPDNVASITYLKGLAATNRYGSLGKGGVIEITTKTYAGSRGKNKKNKKALGTTPTYTGSVALMSELPNKEYIKELKSKTDINDALNTYLSYRNMYGDDPEFFLNVARYFKGWNKPEITARILSNVTEVANNDLVTLKALLYLYEDTRDYTSQVRLAEHILDLDDTKAQSYLDLARAYRLARDYDVALDIYNKIVSPSGSSGVNFSGIKETAIKEYKQFVVSSGQKIKMNKIFPAYRKAPEKVARRIVVEYNNPEALFDLKIINPQNRFFTWSHTTTGESARLQQEKQQGFNQEEFFLTDTDKGNWRFNVINYGTKRDNVLASTFLKITIFNNWGSLNQTREVKIIQLSEVNKEQQILSLTI